MTHTQTQIKTCSLHQTMTQTQTQVKDTLS